MKLIPLILLAWLFIVMYLVFQCGRRYEHHHLEQNLQSQGGVWVGNGTNFVVITTTTN